MNDDEINTTEMIKALLENDDGVHFFNANKIPAMAAIQLRYKKRRTFFRFYFPPMLYGLISRIIPVYEELLDCSIEE